MLQGRVLKIKELVPLKLQWAVEQEVVLDMMGEVVKLLTFRRWWWGWHLIGIQEFTMQKSGACDQCCSNLINSGIY